MRPKRLLVEQCRIWTDRTGPLRRGSCIVLCSGVFDIFHAGHLEHLKQAKALGDMLFVGIVGDHHVRKGPGRPVFNEDQRADVVAALGIVDFVIVMDSPHTLPLLERLRPDIWCKGSDYRDPANPYGSDFEQGRAFVESYGGKVVFTAGYTASSTRLLTRLREALG